MSLSVQVPKKLSDLVEIVTVDDDTVQIKDRKTGAVLQTVTREEIEHMRAVPISINSHG